MSQARGGGGSGTSARCGFVPRPAGGAARNPASGLGNAAETAVTKEAGIAQPAWVPHKAPAAAQAGNMTWPSCRSGQPGQSGQSAVAAMAPCDASVAAEGCGDRARKTPQIRQRISANWRKLASMVGITDRVASGPPDDIGTYTRPASMTFVMSRRA